MWHEANIWSYIRIDSFKNNKFQNFDFINLFLSIDMIMMHLILSIFVKFESIENIFF